MAYFTGEYFDGKSSRSEDADVQLTSQSLLLRSTNNSPIGEWELDRLRDEYSPPVEGAILLSLAADNSARLKITDPDALFELRTRCPKLTQKRKAEKREWPKLVAAAAGTLVVVAGLVYYGMPVIAGAVAEIIPETTRQNLGQAVEERILMQVTKSNKNKNAVCSSVTADLALSRVISQFSNGEPASVLVVKSKIANAFALPGGRIIIFSGLIDKAADANALVGVLAHEFAHVEARHPTSLLVANLGMAAVLSIVLGDVTGGTLIAGAGQMALGASYSRDFERAADQRAIEFMRQNNYDVGPLIPLLKKIQKSVPEKNVLSFMVSHPDIDSRVETLKAAGVTGTQQAFTEREWQEIKVMCTKSV